MRAKRGGGLAAGSRSGSFLQGLEGARKAAGGSGRPGGRERGDFVEQRQKGGPTTRSTGHFEGTEEIPLGYISLNLGKGWRRDTHFHRARTNYSSHYHTYTLSTGRSLAGKKARGGTKDEREGKRGKKKKLSRNTQTGGQGVLKTESGLGGGDLQLGKRQPGEEERWLKLSPDLFEGSQLIADHDGGDEKRLARVKKMLSDGGLNHGSTKRRRDFNHSLQTDREENIIQAGWGKKGKTVRESSIRLMGGSRAPR